MSKVEIIITIKHTTSRASSTISETVDTGIYYPENRDLFLDKTMAFAKQILLEGQNRRKK